MICPKCKQKTNHVTNTKFFDEFNYLERERKCRTPNCFNKFITYEQISPGNTKVPELKIPKVKTRKRGSSRGGAVPVEPKSNQHNPTMSSRSRSRSPPERTESRCWRRCRIEKSCWQEAHTTQNPIRLEQTKKDQSRFIIIS